MAVKKSSGSNERDDVPPNSVGKKASSGARFLVNVAAFVIVIAGMRAAEPLLVPLILSVFFAIICAPPLFWMEEKKIPKGIAILIVIAAIIGLQVLVVAFIGTSVNDFTDNLPRYESRLQEETASIRKWLENKGAPKSNEAIFESFDLKAVFRLVGKTFVGVGGILSNTFLILITVIFMVMEASSFPNKLRAISGGDDGESLVNLKKIVNNIKHYMVIKTLVSLATGIFIAIWLLILRVDYPWLWGMLAFFLNFVPNIGSIIAAIPPALLAFVQFGWGKLLLTALGYVIVNVMIGNIIEPRFMGRGLGLSTLVVFVSLVFWGWVLGPVGMLLSVPLTMTAKIALESNDDTRWIAILLGSDVSAAPAPSKL